MAKCSKTLSLNITKRMAELGLSQADLARKIGQSPSYVSQVIRGVNQSPALDTLEKIALALETTLIHLLGSQDELQRLSTHSESDCAKVCISVLERSIRP